MSNALALYANMDQTWKVAQALSQSELLPPHFRGKPSNVLIALEFAHRNDIAPFAAMQSMFVISGKIGMTAAMAISLARKHNVWKSLTYKVEGSGESLKVTAIAKLHDDTTTETSMSLKTAIDAGWTKNAIWKSIPEQMLRYRAAVFLIRSNFPEVLFGMQTVEEIQDVQAKDEPVKPIEAELIEAPKTTVERAKEVINEKETGKFKQKKSYLDAKIIELSTKENSSLNVESLTKLSEMVDGATSIKELDKAYEVLQELVI